MMRCSGTIVPQGQAALGPVVHPDRRSAEYLNSTATRALPSRIERTVETVHLTP